MPPRLVTLAIVAFWLVTTGWLVYREVLPAMRSGEPPPFIIDLADEVSAQTITWQAWQKGQHLGEARTKVVHGPDRTFVLKSKLTPNDLRFLTISINQMESSYAVTRDGDLRELKATVKVKAGPYPLELSVGGKVDHGVFTPEIRCEGLDLTDLPLPKLESVPVAAHGSVLNPLHPLNRIKNLSEGQHWVQPVIDPLIVALYSVVKWEPPVRRLHAQVGTGTLPWNRQEAACWCIEYSEPGQKASARTWVRRSDGLVLKQEASHGGLELVLERNPPH
jgi:hypothetical protein